MSTGKRTLASLKDFTQAPNSRAALESLLYGDDVDYKGLRYVRVYMHVWLGVGVIGLGRGVFCRAFLAHFRLTFGIAQARMYHEILISLPRTSSYAHAITPHPTMYTKFTASC